MDRVSLLLLLPLAVFVYRLWGFGRREHYLPPGPPTRAIIGNIHLFPKAFLQLQFSKWAREYGDVFSVKVFNSTMVVISSPSAVKDILDKLGSATGGRPGNHMQIAADGLHMAMESMNTGVWRRGRKALHVFLTAEAVHRHLPTQQAESLQLLHDLLTSPEELFTHIMRTTASLISSLVYGKRFLTFRNSDAEVYFEGIKLLNAANDTTKFPPIEILPWLKYIPRWLAPWTAHCDRVKLVRNRLYYSLLDECERKYKAGEGTGSYIENVLKSQQQLGLSRDEISFLGAALMDAGAETTASFLQGFVLALLSYPECQRLARNEIDIVVGSDRMPTLADYESLPYLKALVNEVHRFRPLMPVGLPRMATDDIAYKGNVIPKGSMLFMNTWGIMHDPDLFDEPESFRPERFLESPFGTKQTADVTNFRDNFGFGAGRRICPGENMGRRTIALNTMNLLWAFEFAPMKNTKSFTMGMDEYVKPGLEMAPEPFVCDIKVRDDKRAAMIRSSFSSVSYSY